MTDFERTASAPRTPDVVRFCTVPGAVAAASRPAFPLSVPVRFALCFLLLAPIAGAGETDLDRLVEDASAGSWQTRWRAVRALSRLGSEDAVFKVRALLLRDPRPRVRAAVAWACRLEPSLAGSASLLAIALKKDEAPAVRRAAAGALVHFKNRYAVTALVDALGKETDARTRLHIVETLRSITPAPCLLDDGAWRAWWKEHAHDPRFRPADEAAVLEEYEGVELETRTVAPIPGKDEPRRKPPHVLVLPGFGWTTAMYGPYLLPLREKAAITWVRLPNVQKLTGRSGYGADIATYPVGRLVRALDKLRESHGIERFVILAPGASGWIAMRYAVTHEDRCAGLVLIDSALDKQAYAASLMRAAARGDEGEKFTANTLTHRNNVPLNEATLHRLQALGLARGFRDPADLEIAWLFSRAREPQGFATVPDIKWSRHREIDVPALFLYSANSAFSGHHEADRIQRHFPRSLVAPIDECRGLPFVERNEKFHRVLNAFLERFDLVG